MLLDEDGRANPGIPTHPRSTKVDFNVSTFTLTLTTHHVGQVDHADAMAACFATHEPFRITRQIIHDPHPASST